MKWLNLKLAGIDRYRDGGSMSISFFDSYGDKYILVFQAFFSPEMTESIDYSLVIERYRKKEVASPITGIIRQEWNKELLLSSWNECLGILAEVQNQVAQDKIEKMQLFKSMINIAKLKTGQK